jgi:lipopolysaccharide export system permease protein
LDRERNADYPVSTSQVKAPSAPVIFQRSLIREFSLIAIAVIARADRHHAHEPADQAARQGGGRRRSAEAVLGLIAFGILTYLPVLLGIAVFIAVLLALTRSYRDSEMTVWFTSGLSLAAWVQPVLQFALPVALVCALLPRRVAVVAGAERRVPAPAREPRRGLRA